MGQWSKLKYFLAIIGYLVPFFEYLVIYLSSPGIMGLMFYGVESSFIDLNIVIIGLFNAAVYFFLLGYGIEKIRNRKIILGSILLLLFLALNTGAYLFLSAVYGL